ncbi:MAG: pantothenate synthetase [Crocinitomicaceae bacterium]|nr:pantothenate synthetase [Crocinitomicaceae bacterium]
MGALHEGHLSLIARSRKECGLTVASIFINPTQFNNSADFEKYPVRTEEDKKLLENAGCDVLFLPEKEEVYPPGYDGPRMDIGFLNEIMEGKFRPGHFEGVIEVVYRLFDIVKPNKAYFGLKDFQQVAVIRQMTAHFGLPVEIVPCTTIRETDGLALSSRNMRLNAGERQEALFIYHSLILARDLASKLSPAEIKAQIETLYARSSLRLEYVEIIDPKSFETLEQNWVEGAVACIVAYVGEVRLIDNMCIYSCD